MTKSYEDWCVHFRGIQYPTCTADVDWRQLTGGADFGIATRMPCIKSNASTVACAQCRYPTAEEAAAHETALEAHLARAAEDMALIGAAHTDEATSLVYVCELCDRAARTVTATAQELAAHLTEAHGIDDPTIRSARSRMTAHMDARDWHQTDHAFTLPDGRELLLRSARYRRRGAERAVWHDAATPTGRKRGTR